MNGQPIRDSIADILRTVYESGKLQVPIKPLEIADQILSIPELAAALERSEEE